LAPDLSFAYVADTEGFPYGNRSTTSITNRAIALVQQLEREVPLATLVLACNTLSTLSLAGLRAQFPFYFVGTVPAVKVAAAQSKSKRFTLLATPNTAQSDYSKNLINEFAAGCKVDSYGAPHLAAMAERFMLGTHVTTKEWQAEIAPAFMDDMHGKTDAVVLGCTHYPLVLPQLQEAAPWAVQWIDSSEAIARRALSQPAVPAPSVAYVTREADVARYSAIFEREGFSATRCLDVGADLSPHAALA
jgi:glutamate racemase